MARIVTNEEVNALHAEAVGHSVDDDDWNDRLGRHSVSWATARDEPDWLGFTNTIWDGLVRAFVEDTNAAARARRHGVGARLIEVARKHSANAGCEWLHVDFEHHLRSFYFDACGFGPTNAGLIKLG